MEIHYPKENGRIEGKKGNPVSEAPIQVDGYGVGEIGTVGVPAEPSLGALLRYCDTVTMLLRC